MIDYNTFYILLKIILLNKETAKYCVLNQIEFFLLYMNSNKTYDYLLECAQKNTQFIHFIRINQI